MGRFKRLRFAAWLLLACILHGQCFGKSGEPHQPEVANGVLDLRGIKLDRKQAVSLSGDWKFYWHHLIKESDPDNPIRETGTFFIPGNWSGKAAGSEKLPAFGFATFQLRILTDSASTAKKVYLSLPKVFHAQAVYQKNSIQKESRLVGFRGQVAKSPKSFVPDSRALMIELELAGQTDVYVQVSNYLDESASGIVREPILGLKEAVLTYDRLKRQVDFMIIGSIVSIGFFMFCLYALRQSEKGPFWLAMFCFIIAIRILWWNRYINEMFPWLEFHDIFHKINYLTITLAIPCYLMFLIRTFRRSFENKLNFGLIAISMLYSLLVAILPIPIFSKALNLFLIFILVVLFSIAYCYLRSLIKEYNGFLLLAFLGSMSIVCFGGAEVFFKLWLNKEANFIQYGLLINVLFMGFIVSLSNTLARQKSERLSRALIEEVAYRKQAEEELSKVNQNLEKLVSKRTLDLEEAYKTLVDNAHKAGMAEIAANTLHNVGNVLNSLTTSTIMIRKSIAKSPIEGYRRANKMLRENLPHFSDFLQKDPKGRKLLEYYLELEKAFSNTFSAIMENVERLNRKANTIKDIIVSQNRIVGPAALVETLDIKDIVEDALGMLPEAFYRENIAITKSYNPIPQIPIQKSKLIHILVNLFTNSYHAMRHINDRHKSLLIEVDCDRRQAWINVTDSGRGISAENLKKVFLHGFTTKSSGNGFGLHSSAIYMEEMGGKIEAKSKGEGQGTTIALVFPLVDIDASDTENEQSVPSYNR